MNEAYREELCNNLILSGGSTMFPGLIERLDSELKLLKPEWNFKIHAPEDRKCLSFVGAKLSNDWCKYGHRWVT